MWGKQGGPEGVLVSEVWGTHQKRKAPTDCADVLKITEVLHLTEGFGTLTVQLQLKWLNLSVAEKKGCMICYTSGKKFF